MSLNQPFKPGPMADEVSAALAGAQSRATDDGSPVVELEHLYAELVHTHPIVLDEVLASLDLTRSDVTPAPDARGRARAPSFGRAESDSSPVRGLQELQVTSEVGSLLGSASNGDLADSVSGLCKRVVGRLVAVGSSDSARHNSDPLVVSSPSGDPALGGRDGALDLTDLASVGALDPLIGREAEIRQITRILLRRRKRNPLLVGPPGVGKTALVEGLAQRIESDDVPPPMRDWRVIALSIPKMLAGTSYRGEFEARMDGVLQRATASTATHVLFIDEFYLVITAGAAKGGIDAASILKPYMARGDLVVIGACSDDDLSEQVMSDPALKRRMAVVAVDELNLDATRDVLEGMRSLMEQHHSVVIDAATLDRCVALVGERGSGFRPDNALELLDDACAEAILSVGVRGDGIGPIEVSADHVDAVFG